MKIRNTDWLAAVEDEIRAAVSVGGPDDYIRANVEAVRQAVRGLGPDSASDAVPEAGAGVRVVFNISCTHVPALCDSGGSYKNTYDLGTVSSNRKAVDLAVQEAAKNRNGKLRARNIYFGAAETSGAGIRFYGDMCLVLRDRPAFASGAAETKHHPRALLVLNRNSYDVIRAPVAAAVKIAAGASTLAAARAEQLIEWMGTWEADLLNIIALKVLQQQFRAKRRWTTGQVAQTVLADEDYVEVLYPKSFAAKDILEVRLSAADVAAEAEIAAREANGEAPLPEEACWRQQRREARRALAKVAIPVRVVLTAGRVKSS